MQVEGRSQGTPVYETLEPQEGVGLAVAYRNLRPATSSSTSKAIPSSGPVDSSISSDTSRRTIPATAGTRGYGDCRPRKRSETSKSSWTG